MVCYLYYIDKFYYMRPTTSTSSCFTTWEILFIQKSVVSECTFIILNKQQYEEKNDEIG